MIPGAAGQRLGDCIVGLGREVVVMLVVGWMRPKPGHHTPAAMTPVVRVELCREIAKPD